MKNNSLLSLLVVLTVLSLSVASFGAATVVIVNGDPAGSGFNDPTPVAPVGGNAGTTLGEQRLIAFQAAADKWGATLTSDVTITVLATWEALSCTSSGAVLGSAGATEVFTFDPPVPPPLKANTLYGKAETNKYAGSDVDPSTADIRARFNINLGNTGCLDGTFWYLGLDANHGSNIDLVTVLTHEFGHGLGFQTYTSGLSGAQLAGFPSIWDYYLYDSSTGKNWTQMTNAERQASALKYGKLVWTGATVTSQVPNVLQVGLPVLTVATPTSVAGVYSVGSASFGPALSSPGVTGEVMPGIDSTGSSLGCNAYTGAAAAALSGKIALVDRGTCTFVVKAKNLQNAGAIGMIVADNAAGSPPAGLGGSDPTITIPAVRITQADGVTLKTALKTRSRLHSGMFANLGVNTALRAGADLAGHIMMYAPNPYQSGSSVSHYDVSCFPNQLMEPNINGDLTHEVTPNNDLSFPLLQDIGW